MSNISMKLNSRLCTSNVPTAQDFNSPSFEYKDNIAYNGTIQNMHVKTGSGVLLTSGKSLEINPADDGATLKDEDGRTYKLPFKYLLSNHITVPELMAGEQICHSFYKERIYTIYKNNDAYSLCISDTDGELITSRDLDCSSAIISSVYNLDCAPYLFTLTRDNQGSETYYNYIKGYSLDDLDTAIIDYQTEDFIPLGDLDSATIRNLNDKKTIFCGFDNDDKNRTRTIIWTEGKTKPTTYRWFGCVSVRGDITGEPIPNPDDLAEPQRQDNGTYLWNTWDSTTSKFIGWTLIGGYTVNENSQKIEPIEIEESREGAAGIDTTSTTTYGTCLRTNMSVNDALGSTSTSTIYPMMYYVSNYADSRGVYYDYGPGWMRTYVRKTSTATPTTLAPTAAGKIYCAYIYTFGCKGDSLSNRMSRTRKESIMAQGKTEYWDYSALALNTRIYTIGGTNNGDDSILATMPFTVEILPSTTDTSTNKNIRSLDMQMYALLSLSFSYNKTLITTSSDENAEHWTVLANDEEIVLCINDDVYVIKSYDDYTTAYKDVKIDKVADFNYRTNILDEDNLISEDRLGNIEITRSFIPYNMEGIIDIGDLKLTPPSATETDVSYNWYWAAGYNCQLVGNTVSDKSCSYLFPLTTFGVYVDSTEQSAFEKGVINNRQTLVKPLLKGLFYEDEGVDIYYTLSSVSTSAYYKASRKVKLSLLSPENAIYGAQVFETDKSNMAYPISSGNDTAIAYYPIGVGSTIEGINYMTPTVKLLNNYASRLYSIYNNLYLCYNYSSRIYYGSQVFTIYGNNYYYDGQAIYYTGSQNDYSNSQFICYALGLTYLSNSGSEAYFYSNWEKKIFVFTGSCTMQPADSLSNIGEITDSLFSSKEQILYLLTDDNKLIIRASEDVAGIEDIPDGASLIGTDNGAGIIYEEDDLDKYKLFSPRERDGYEYLPYRLETEYLGTEGHNLRCEAGDVQLYNISPNKTIKVTMKMQTLAGVEESADIQVFTITPKDWKGRNYRLRITPRFNVGNAFKIQIESDDKIAVSYIGFSITDLDKQTSAPHSGASGFKSTTRR